MYEPYLAHYGVKGMKWGVRRNRESSSGSDSSTPQSKRAQTMVRDERSRKRRVRAVKAVGVTYAGAALFGVAYMQSKTVRVGVAAASYAAKRGAAHAAAALAGHIASPTPRKSPAQPSAVDVGEAIVRKVS